MVFAHNLSLVSGCLGCDDGICTQSLIGEWLFRLRCMAFAHNISLVSGCLGCMHGICMQSLIGEWLFRLR